MANLSKCVEVNVIRREEQKSELKNERKIKKVKQKIQKSGRLFNLKMRGLQGPGLWNNCSKPEVARMIQKDVSALKNAKSIMMSHFLVIYIKHK